MKYHLSSHLTQCLLLLMGLTLSWVSLAGERGPVIPKGQGDRCVADTNFMRRNHMDLIIHQRDETVLRGIRDEPFSLVECVECHVQKDANNEPIRIDAPGQFCASCHAYVGLKTDCYSCHASVPDRAANSDNASLSDSVAVFDNAVSDKAILDKKDPNKVIRDHWLPHKQLLAFKSKASNGLTPALEDKSDEQRNTKPE